MVPYEMTVGVMGLKPRFMKINRIMFFSCIGMIVCVLAVMGFFTHSYSSKAVSLQDNVYSLSDINKELEKKLTLLEKENADLKAQIETGSLERQEAGNRIQELEKRIAELEAEKKAYETSPNFASVKPRQKVAYLTIDDGPSPYTEKILDILRKYGVRATFFVNGRENAGEAYKSILKEGHVIGNHSYSHDYETLYTTVEGFFADFDRLNMLIKETTGYEPEIFRFPGGSKNAASKKYGGSDIMQKIMKGLEERGVKYFDWNVTSADADISGKTVPKDVIVKNILSGAQYKRSAIILMHDSIGKETTVEALPEVIEGLTEQGFRFGVLTGETKS